MPRIAVIDRDACLKAQCHICIKVCPVNRIGQPCIVADDETYPVIDENLCTGCGICPKKCPTKVISVINLMEEAGERMHQYGVNSFRLYNLPLPQKGVTGLVGQNGIGKTTAIQILSGSLVPNLGEWWRSKDEKEWNSESVIGAFRGRDLGNFFIGLKEGIHVSYKQQNVDKLRSETAVSVFLGISQRLEQVIDSLGLHNLLNKKMNELSGGELQMVAIAQAMSQDAELYFFDEPCSYLDVKQRLVAAHAIRELSEKAFVMVTEHDLAVLDYLTDYTYLLYGEPGTYGVVSGLKASRTGINEYLDGFLSEENLRIRNEPIVFDVRGLESVEKTGKILLDYGDMEKKYTGFSLNSSAGTIKDGEIIGVLGPNATGKTTFVKMLAGVEHPDKGEQLRGLKISYKPQYVRSPNGSVKDVLDEFDIDKAVLLDLQKELALESLMEKECQKLSGGELQRLAIAISLAQDADIYLLDEPSAFLDVEQRLRLAKVLKKRIKDGKAAFVVDHDIVFIDNISDRLVAFEGISGVDGTASAPLSKREGMNLFLKQMDITMRRDKDTLRPRINKPGSVLDREQKEAGEYYYA